MKHARKIVLAVMLIAISYILMVEVFADVGGADGIGLYGSTRRSINGTGAQSTYAQAGNVTQMEINATLISEFWAGFVGNVSGQITLDNGNNDTMYDWDLDGVVTGEIYASQQSAIDFSTIVCMDATNLTFEELRIGQNSSTSKGDNVSATFLAATAHPSFNVGDRAITTDSCPAMNIYDDTGAQTLAWFNIMLKAGTGAFNYSVYTTLINDTVTGYDGGTYDFQMMMGENGNPADAGGSTYTQYYFWVELQDS